jgi:hypothetical protein
MDALVRSAHLPAFGAGASIEVGFDAALLEGTNVVTDSIKPWRGASK